MLGRKIVCAEEFEGFFITRERLTHLPMPCIPLAGAAPTVIEDRMIPAIGEGEASDPYHRER
jgi:hypothetical protein